MGRNKLVDVASAVARIADGATLAIVGSGGGLLEPDYLLAAIEARFLATGHPRDLTILHAQGIGDKDRRGLNRLAHEGLVRRMIGGHWSWSPRMQELARANLIEAWSLPGGVISLLMREQGAGRPGLFTPVGLGTFVDPRLQGGRMNAAAKEALVEHVVIRGRDYLHYRPIPVDVAILRGSTSDPEGNISFEREPANLDSTALALAARASGGFSLVEVGQVLEIDHRGPREIVLPSPLVGNIVLNPDPWQSHVTRYDPAISGQIRAPDAVVAPPPDGVRGFIARRAAKELRAGDIASFGFGIPDGVARILAASPGVDYLASVDHGVYGGESLDGALFGFVRNPDVIINATDQLDFYHGGGLDIAFLGFGEVDRRGDVNASMIGGLPVGPGVFMDIAHGARKIVFCGTFDAIGSKVVIEDGRVRILQHGRQAKFVDAVAQITFAGAAAIAAGKQVLYVTERAVFELAASGLRLTEVAPGVDIRADILDRMDFMPDIADLKTLAV